MLPNKLHFYHWFSKPIFFIFVLPIFYLPAFWPSIFTIHLPSSFFGSISIIRSPITNRTSNTMVWWMWFGFSFFFVFAVLAQVLLLRWIMAEQLNEDKLPNTSLSGYFIAGRRTGLLLSSWHRNIPRWQYIIQEIIIFDLKL